MSTGKSDKDTLFYDGACPLCRREMNTLAKLSEGRLSLVDIHSLKELPANVSRHDLLRVLHLQKADGQWLRGADANVAAWQTTPRGKWLRWMRWPGVRWLVDTVYSWWAKRRYDRLYGPDGARRPRDTA